MGATARAWCPTCRGRKAIVDTFTESVYERDGEQAFLVTELACGCYVESARVRVGTSPGAPYAGSLGPGAGVVVRTDPWV